MTSRLVALLVTMALLGFLVGARAIGGPALPEPAAREAGMRESDALGGGFWRPATSNAERPVLRLAPLRWTPSTSNARRVQPDAFAAMRAAVRLASLE